VAKKVVGVPEPISAPSIACKVNAVPGVDHGEVASGNDGASGASSRIRRVSAPPTVLSVHMARALALTGECPKTTTIASSLAG
jgi:hypothetical protein